MQTKDSSWLSLLKVWRCTFPSPHTPLPCSEPTPLLHPGFIHPKKSELSLLTPQPPKALIFAPESWVPWFPGLGRAGIVTIMLLSCSFSPCSSLQWCLMPWGLFTSQAIPVQQIKGFLALPVLSLWTVPQGERRAQGDLNTTCSMGRSGSSRNPTAEWVYCRTIPFVRFPKREVENFHKFMWESI